MNYEIASKSKELKDRTQAFVMEIIRLFSVLPKSPEAQVIGKQSLRSKTCVGANYNNRNRCKNRDCPYFMSEC